MMPIARMFAAVAVAMSMIPAASALAGGDKNAYNNPTGDPPDDTYQAPYANVGEGRMMVFCAEDEKLVVTPIDTGAVEITCVPDED